MIINRIRAENVLKYALLELDEIPEQGLIAVIGDNESGKSSIGESICFALFGRTFSLDPGDLDKVIRWGESRCSMRLDFTTPGGQRYQIARFLDELGNHGASLSRIGEEPMVRGVAETAAVLKEVIGFGYTEFVESFYLAQREITTPHPHSFAVKAMAGVDALEKVVASCRDESERARKRGEETEAQKGDIDTQIKTLGFEETRLGSLREQHATIARELDADRRRIGRLKTVCEHNETALASIKDAAENWLSVPAAASLRERRSQSAALRDLIAGLDSRYSRDDLTAKPFSALSDFSRDLQQRLESVETLFGNAENYRSRLARLLDSEPAVGPLPQEREQAEPRQEGAGDTTERTSTGYGPESERPFSERREALRTGEKNAASSRIRSHLGAVLFLLSALAAWALWGLPEKFPDDPQVQALSAWLSAFHSGWESILMPWLPYIAALLSVVCIAFIGRGYGLGQKLQRLREQGALLTEEEVTAGDEHASLQGLDSIPLADACGNLKDLREEKLSQQAAALTQGGVELLETEANSDYRTTFRRIMQRLEKGISSIKTGATEEIEGLHEAVTDRTGAAARISGEIERENERKRRHQELNAIARALAGKVEEANRRVKVRELAIDLLGGAIHYISQRFNMEIRNLAADALPKLTNGRYEHLQIDDNLKVKAFSNEKRNFMELDEISSGTQRQIMLAVRLALSQKLVNSVIQGTQMLFLDEPFAFFDEGRTASSLTVLPRVSGEFTQIWVTSQTFPAQSRFDLYIECSAAQSHSPKIRRDPGVTPLGSRAD